MITIIASFHVIRGATQNRIVALRGYQRRPSDANASDYKRAHYLRTKIRAGAARERDLAWIRDYERRIGRSMEVKARC